MDIAVRSAHLMKFPHASWTTRQCVCLAVKAIVFIGLIALALRGGDWALGALELLDPAGGVADPFADWRLWAAIAVYIALMAIPFCPGIELGLALMAIGGTNTKGTPNSSTSRLLDHVAKPASASWASVSWPA